MPDPYPARWAEPAHRPSAAGLAVAALVGGIAAGSWSLSAWLALGRVATPPSATLPLAAAYAADGATLAAQTLFDNLKKDDDH